MITTMNEIEQRFDAIKDHKPKASKKLNELGEILASAYKINPDRADEMWQYLVELNVRDDEKNAKFYIAQVFNKVKGLIPADEATDLIWQNFVENIEENNLLPMPEEYEEEEAKEFANSKIGFFVNLIAENDQLLTKYFENDRGIL